jgi:hypothetical protein
VSDQNEKRAPVQGWHGGIPWEMHLRAYEVYCKKYGPQPAMVDLEGRGCRGGFHADELDAWIPGWRDELSTITAQKKRIAELEDQLTRKAVEANSLRELLNTPLFDDFTQAVSREAAHQIQRWGRAHDRSKSAENWFWLVGYLAGKALRAAIKGDLEKAKHHTISTAAALMQWHAAISTDATGEGVGEDADLRAKEVA